MRRNLHCPCDFAHRLLSGLYLPAMPFSGEMWLGVLVSAIIGTVALIFVECFLLRRQRARGDVAVTAAVCRTRGNAMSVLPSF